MIPPIKNNRSQLAKRYTVGKNYSLIRFFHLENQTQKYHDIEQFIEFIGKHKINIDFVGYELKTIRIFQKINCTTKDVYFFGHDEEHEKYYNVYSNSLCEFNDFLDVYYQWVNVDTGHCFVSASFILTRLNMCDERVERLAIKILNEKKLVL